LAVAPGSRWNPLPSPISNGMQPIRHEFVGLLEVVTCSIISETRTHLPQYPQNQTSPVDLLSIGSVEPTNNAAERASAPGVIGVTQLRNFKSALEVCLSTHLTAVMTCASQNETCWITLATAVAPLSWGALLLSLLPCCLLEYHTTCFIPRTLTNYYWY